MKRRRNHLVLMSCWAGIVAAEATAEPATLAQEAAPASFAQEAAPGGARQAAVQALVRRAGRPTSRAATSATRASTAATQRRPNFNQVSPLFRTQALTLANAGNAPITVALGGTLPPPPSPARRDQVDRSPESPILPRSSEVLTISAYARGTVVQHASAWRDTAVQHYRLGRYREASVGFDTALAMMPEDDFARLGQTMCSLLLGRSDAAATRLHWILARSAGSVLRPQWRDALRPGDSEAVLLARRTLTSRAESGDSGTTAARALLTVLLWYDGQESDARAQAEALQRLPDGARYAALTTEATSTTATETGGHTNP
ncbi:MAG: hypothetical protein FLDDKLPJ_01151 [Phycisphaerae bacterium]|nr:hypothetical protein [Phycisphaerae bacterium]